MRSLSSSTTRYFLAAAKSHPSLLCGPALRQLTAGLIIQTIPIHFSSFYSSSSLPSQQSPRSSSQQSPPSLLSVFCLVLSSKFSQNSNSLREFKPFHFQSTYSPQDHYLMRGIPQDREQKLSELIFQTIPALPDTYHH